MSIIKGVEAYLYKAPCQKRSCMFECAACGKEHKLAEGGFCGGHGACPGCSTYFQGDTSRTQTCPYPASHSHNSLHYESIECGSKSCNYWDQYKHRTNPWAQGVVKVAAKPDWQDEQQPDCNHMKYFEERSAIIKERFAEAIAIFAKHGHLLSPYVVEHDEKENSNKVVGATPIIFNPLATERVVIKCAICDNELRIEQRRHLPPGMEPFSGVTTGLRCEDFRKRK